MPYQNPPEICPVCKEKADFKFIQDYKSKEGEWSLYECPKCQVQFWMPFRNPGREWYEEKEESQLIRSSHKKKTKLTWQHKEFLKFFKNQNNQGKKLLDLGCGTGEFLNAVQELGFEVWGVDFDRNTIEYAKSSYNLKNVYAESIEEFSLRKSLPKFDVITFFEVIEHIDDIPNFFHFVTEVGKEGAYIALSTPNRNRKNPDNPRSGDYPPIHLTRWNIDSLNNILRLHHINIEKYKYGNEIECFISRNCRFNTVRKIKQLQKKTFDKSRPSLLSDKTINFVHNFAKLKDKLLIPIVFVIVHIQKFLNIYGEGDDLFVIARLQKNREHENKDD
jgi:SAM-dependent methyltransferase